MAEHPPRRKPARHCKPVYRLFFPKHSHSRVKIVHVLSTVIIPLASTLGKIIKGGLVLGTTDFDPATYKRK